MKYEVVLNDGSRLPGVSMELREVKKCRAIVMFGPATDTSGTRPGTYYQVTLDPRMVSPSGEYVYFGATDGDQITGWQHVDGLTVCEVLGEYNEDGTYPEAKLEEVQPLLMKHIV